MYFSTSISMCKIFYLNVRKEKKEKQIIEIFKFLIFFNLCE